MAATPLRRGSLPTRLADAIGDFSVATPARFALLVFAGLIAVFAVLFSLPAATSSGRAAPLVDAVFTAVSVICVTGLSTVDMATFWSPIGHVFVFVGVEIGGIGVLTLASILGLIISRKLGLRQKLLAAGDANPLNLRKGVRADAQALQLGDTGGLIVTVAVSVLVIELATSVLLFPRMLLAGDDPWTAGWQSVYTSAMAFTNTGFLPSSVGLGPYAHDAWYLIVLMIAVGFGAIGFPVLHTLARNPWHPRRWSLHVKLTLTTFLLLLAGGALALMLLQWDGAQRGLDPGQRILESLFQSSMSRSGGFSTIDIGHLGGASLFVTDMLMFVGGGSASTAGGIKVTTLAILFLGAFAEARGVDDMESFRRRVPADVMRLAVTVVGGGATTVAAATITLLVMTRAPLEDILFDVISAFATCGLSTGFTASASEPAQYVLAATMFMGRIGTVTLAAALAASTRRQLVRRPEERPIVG
jgi:Trk-type K+ transport system membrane component